MKTSPAAEENPNGVLRRISFNISPLTPRVVRARSKSVTHVSSKYESLDYDVWENDILVKEEQSNGYHVILRTNIIRWMLYLLTGLITGMIAVAIDYVVDHLFAWKARILQSYMNYCFEKPCSNFAYTAWYLSVIIPALMGCLVVVLFEPSAAGSGIPSVISHLNGVKIPKFANSKALFIKICSLMCSCVSGLATGKEGPFIYIGSTVGSIMSSLKLYKVPYLSKNLFRLNSVQEERDLMAGGVAAGVSAAFGSPVGATLLSLEEGTSFWSVMLMWKIFFCAIFASFSFDPPGQHTYFGKFNETMVEYEYFELPFFFGVGVIGGLIGAFFVFIQLKVSVFRMRYVNTKLLKIIDTIVISFLTAALGIFSMYSLRSCNEIIPQVYEPHFTLKMFCEESQHNQMSVFWFQNQEQLLRLLFHSPINTFGFLTLSVYFVIYFFLFSLTAGLSLSVGIFIPSLILGATWGRIFGLIMHKIFPQLGWAVPAKYALLGAASQQSGIVRITISLIVIVVEATGTLNFVFPLMLTLFTTKWVGDFFTEGIYKMQINLSGIPILPAEPPPLTSDIVAKDLMNTKVVAFPLIVSVDYIVDTLSKVSHQGFPVVKEINSLKGGNIGLKTCGELRGFILRSQLITLLITKSYTIPTTAEEIHRMIQLFLEYKSKTMLITEVDLSEEERKYNIDLSPYMNPSPYCVQLVMSFPRIFRLLKSLGLRHVIVVDNKNQVMGIITRKDLAKFRLWRYAVTMGLKELRVQ
ncbi:H(+)/Cl(-) exchange transporter 7-like isoform X2 [Planococcus citri]|uniref:H(+)/Cl(-) exchange transporter 7-like isoform X2 n=1 Tax=Planococcus citri TaxID=170843 RepID=UPI0031F8DB4C